VYDQTIRVLKTAVARARIGNDDRLAALRRLDAEARRLERSGGEADVAAFIAEERKESRARGGMMVGARTAIEALTRTADTPDSNV
jgi:hypothetical protein